MRTVLYWLAMVCVLNVAGDTLANPIVDRIKSMEGEWVVVSRAGTCDPDTNIVFVVQNDVCGSISVGAYYAIRAGCRGEVVSIRNIILRRMGNREVVCMYSTAQTDCAYKYCVGRYDASSNSILWRKNNEGNADSIRWRFSPNNHSYVEEYWDEVTTQWISPENGLLYIHRINEDSIKDVMAQTRFFGLRDVYGNLVTGLGHEQLIANSEHHSIQHTPDAVFFDDTNYCIRVDVSSISYVTQTVVYVQIDSWSDARVFNMTNDSAGKSGVIIPFTDFASYSIAAYCKDGTNCCTHWIRPFRYPPQIRRRDVEVQKKR